MEYRRYELIGGGLKPIDTTKNNNLPIGTILKMNGYNNPEYVITARKEGSFGVMYTTVNLDDFSESNKEAYILKHISEKKDDRIQVYITDNKIEGDELLDIMLKASELKKAKQEAQRIAAEEKRELVERGKKLFSELAPAGTVSVITASLMQDESDIRSDYFGSKTLTEVVLAFSTSKRDTFSEMRKAASKFESTKHLGIKNEENEHREKWSMGAGYYLKAGYRHSNGWKVQKTTWIHDDIYIALAKNPDYVKA